MLHRETPLGFPSSWSYQSTRPHPWPTWLQPEPLAVYLECSGSTALHPSLLSPQTPSLPQNTHLSSHDSALPQAPGHRVLPSACKTCQGPQTCTRPLAGSCYLGPHRVPKDLVCFLLETLQRPPVPIFTSPSTSYQAILIPFPRTWPSLALISPHSLSLCCSKTGSTLLKISPALPSCDQWAEPPCPSWRWHFSGLRACQEGSGVRRTDLRACLCPLRALGAGFQACTTARRVLQEPPRGACR